MAVPVERIRPANAAPVRPERRFVLYWTAAARRVRWNPALERAAQIARELRRPLAVLDVLLASEPYACDRFHAFAMQGMAELARHVAGRVLHHAYVEPAPGKADGLVAALGRDACAVVTDDFPTSSVPEAIAAAARDLDVRLEAVDASCLVPFRLAGRDFPSAHTFRRYLQRTLPRFLDLLPVENPLSRGSLPLPCALPAKIARRWPAADAEDLAHPQRVLASLPIDHRVAPTARGGPAEGTRRLRAFLADGLDRYADDRSRPDAGATSGLSPWLHAGHLSTFEVVRAVLARERFTPALLAPRADGAREGWWGLSRGAEAFLDQLVTWRELGFATCAHRPDHRAYGALPEWARATLARHERDPRPALYARPELASAHTHDPLWNAAQRQLVREGVLHNTLRMLWGKKILEWSPSPREALETALDLNDRFALDGRDPNSISGVFWCFGRYDRPWPERPVFGAVRAMSSERTARKLALAGRQAGAPAVPRRPGAREGAHFHLRRRGPDVGAPRGE